MDIKLEYTISTDEFLEVVESVGWKTYSKEQIDKALKNTHELITWIFKDDKNDDSSNFQDSIFDLHFSDTYSKYRYLCCQRLPHVQNSISD